jgi:hypothetical protein
MTSQKVHLLRCAVSFVIAAYPNVRLTPQDLPASHLELFSKSFIFETIIVM